MKAFLDTNVVMDYLASRGDTPSVNEIFHSIDDGTCQAYISVGSYYTLTYLLELFLKGQGFVNPKRLEMLRDILESLLAKIQISEQSKDDLIRGTKDEQFKDLEDSYQFRAALASGCKYLITSNIKDFQIENPNMISILSPRDFISLL